MQVVLMIATILVPTLSCGFFLDDGDVRGAPEPTDFNDSKVRKALSFVTDRFNQLGNHTYRSIPRGGSVTRQRMLGDVYRFKNLHMIESTCMNTKESQGIFNTTQCPFKMGVEANVALVNAKVYWDLKTFSLLDMDIKDAEHVLS